MTALRDCTDDEDTFMDLLQRFTASDITRPDSFTEIDRFVEHVLYPLIHYMLHCGPHIPSDFSFFLTYIVLYDILYEGFNGETHGLSNNI
jgi:hypothetical protein